MPPAAEIRGTVRDATGAPVAGALLALDGVETGRSGADGDFALPVPPGLHRLEVTAPGFAALAREVAVDPDSGATVELVLEPALRVSEDLVVRAVRAAETAPVTRSEISAERLAALSTGRRCRSSSSPRRP